MEYGRPSVRRGYALRALAVAAVVAAAGPAVAQSPNFPLPLPEIETRLQDQPFQIAGMADNRWKDDRTQRTALRYRDGVTLGAKWAVAPEGGFALNNQPRYERAAYLLQKLFLDEPHWVVPPTVVRVMPHRVYMQLDSMTPPTIENTTSVLVVLQAWMTNVTGHAEPDTTRLDDTAYVHRLGDVNLLTYLINHVDANPGNVMISTEDPPRLYAVDNGVAFRSPESPRGTLWKNLHVDRLPADHVDRLRRITRADLDRLAVVDQFEVGADGALTRVEPTAKINPNRGVDRAGDIVQLGLTDAEIDDIWDRLQALLARIDAGEIRTY